MTASEFKKKYGIAAHTNDDMILTAEQWREMMKKKSKTGSDHVRDIRIMLQLAKITFEEEYKFHETRKWRFDFALVENKIAIEYEGIYSEKSRHTTFTGYTGDLEKYNAAALLGWKVLRYTAKNYKQVIEDLKMMI